LTPQSVHAIGGYKVQGKTDDSAQQLIHAGKALQDAGASLMVVELVPASVGKAFDRSPGDPGDGYRSGAALLRANPQSLRHARYLSGKKPRFVKDFMDGSASIERRSSAS